MAKYKGTITTVEWTGTSPVLAEVEISGESRDFGASGEASEIDASTRDSGDDGEFLTGMKSRTVSMNGLDIEGGAPVLALDLGHIGTLVWYPEGNVAGKRKKSATATVMNTDFQSKSGGLVEWTVEWKISGAITSTTVAP